MSELHHFTSRIKSVVCFCHVQFCTLNVHINKCFLYGFSSCTSLYEWLSILFLHEFSSCTFLDQWLYIFLWVFVMHISVQMTIHILMGFRHAHFCTNDYPYSYGFSVMESAPMSPPGYKGSSHEAQGSSSVLHTRSQRLYAARALSVHAPHARAASAHPDAPGCDAHHENMLCVALAKKSAINKASFKKFICSQFFVQAGFILKRLFDSGRDKERILRLPPSQV